MKGVRCNVYRPAGSTFRPNDGRISHRVNFVTLCGPGVPEHYEATEDAPAVVLVEREIDGMPYYHAEPAGANRYGYVGGDSFLFTLCDIRLRYPIRLHDSPQSLRDFTD